MYNDMQINNTFGQISPYFFLAAFQLCCLISSSDCFVLPYALQRQCCSIDWLPVNIGLHTAANAWRGKCFVMAL